MGKIKNVAIDIMNENNRLWYEDTIYAEDFKQYIARKPTQTIVNIGTKELPILVYKKPPPNMPLVKEPMNS